MGKTLVMTVLGPIPPEELGFTLTHEHVWNDHYRETNYLDSVLNDEALAVEELKFFQAAGGRTLVDLTNRGQGRNPGALKSIALAAGTHVIMGCGWCHQRSYNETIDRMSANELAADMIQDLMCGVDGTAIRAGIIGEIGSDGYITPAEERVLRAAARAHKQTGAAINTHAVCLGSSLGLAQLDILEEEGADLHRVVIGHCDTYLNVGYHEAIIRRGANAAFDGFGKKNIHPDERRLSLLVELLKRGYESQLFLSSDVSRRSYLRTYGGYGYGHLALNILPALKKAGVSDEQIQIMTVENPARVLPF